MADKFIVCGMGGSALAASLIKVAQPDLDLLIHRDYGLPRVPEYFLRESLIILSSYSGNTAEVLDTAEKALAAKLNLAVITSGGKLAEWAAKNGVKTLTLPVGYQPRLALEPACRALGALLGDENLGAMSGTTTLPTGPLDANLANAVPLIYASARNFPLAYHWKISFNETAKVPAFANALPEQNHNELEAAPLSNSHFIFLIDESDDERVKKRFAILEQIYREKNLPVTVVDLKSGKPWDKIWYSVKLAEQTALALANQRGINAPTSLVIEEFKKRLG